MSYTFRLDAVTEVTVTTPQFREGQAAIRQLVAARCTPNWDLVGRQSAEFAAGARHEWDSYYAMLTPAQMESAAIDAGAAPAVDADAEIAAELAELRKQMEHLARYNGTPQGAIAIGKVRDRIETLEALAAL